MQRLRLKRDDGQGWRGTGPDFGVLGEDLNKQLGVDGDVELVDDCSNIKYNRIMYPNTGVQQTWGGKDGGRLVWMNVEAEEGLCARDMARLEALREEQDVGERL